MKTRKWMINYTGYSGNGWSMSYGHVFLSVDFPVEALSQEEVQAAMDRIRTEKEFKRIPIIHSIIPIRVADESTKN